MCGRIGKASKATRDLIRRIGEDEFWRRIQRLDDGAGRRGYNINPGEEDIPFIHAAEGEPTTALGFWGLEPQWVKVKRGAGARYFNCKSERAYPDGPESMIYGHQIRRRRAVLAVDGYYEWKQIGPRKTDKEPWWVYRADGAPLLLGCFYALREWGPSFGIVTTVPNEALAKVHNRAPVVLDPSEFDRWLDPQLRDPYAVRDLVMPTPPDWFAMHRVAPLGDRDEPEMTMPVDQVDPAPPAQGGLFEG